MPHPTSNQPFSLKYRPQSFSALVDQQQVLAPLVQSLNQKKMHPAYLLTGIRGIGKTSIARIIAKSLNCAQGVSATACQKCHACTSIQAGIFPDVLEIDAASKTRVEDIKDILENILYQPTQGAFKVFIIDEVHMLSNHSFNALLKTLEEPPKHVIFILATTDLQKIPATVISRCLRYHLNRITPESIQLQLANILEKEKLNFEPEALSEISLASEGSLRDALSLLQQASYSGSVNTKAVQAMLGVTETKIINEFLQSIASRNLNKALQLVQHCYQKGSVLGKIIAQLIHAIHLLAIYKVTPELVDSPYTIWADQFTHETLQILYQSCLLAKRDLGLSPSEKAAFEMLLLRLIYFVPHDTPEKTLDSKKRSNTAQDAAMKQVPLPHSTHTHDEENRPLKKQGAPQTHMPGTTMMKTSQLWSELLDQLPLSGLTRTLASHTLLKKMTRDSIELLFEEKNKPLLDALFVERFEDALQKHFNRKVLLKLHFSKMPLNQTPHVFQRKMKQDIQDQQYKQLKNDPAIKLLSEKLGATIISESIQTYLKE